MDLALNNLKWLIYHKTKLILLKHVDRGLISNLIKVHFHMKNHKKETLKSSFGFSGP